MNEFLLTAFAAAAGAIAAWLFAYWRRGRNAARYEEALERLMTELRRSRGTDAAAGRILREARGRTLEVIAGRDSRGALDAVSRMAGDDAAVLWGLLVSVNRTYDEMSAKEKRRLAQGYERLAGDLQSRAALTSPVPAFIRLMADASARSRQAAGTPKDAGAPKKH